MSVDFTVDEIIVTLANGEILCNPLAWHPWLQNASPEEQNNFELSTFSIDWPQLDEGLDIEGMRQGIPSDPALRQQQRSDE